MLSLLVGTPGSGKTLYAIDQILKISKKESLEFKHIKFVYTNIAGFKFDMFLDNDVKFDKFIFHYFYEHLKKLFKLYLDNENNDNLDDILQDYCKNNDLLNAYFIIDEAHNNFDNQDKVKNWWFTYHRHLNHEILLITPNKTLINTQYRNIPEIFIKAQPRSKSLLSNTMRYFLFTEYKMTQKFSTVQITALPSYFEFYQSGNLSFQKKAGQKFLIFFAVVVFLLFMFFGFFIYKIFYSNPMLTENQKNEKSKIENFKNENLQIENVQNEKNKMDNIELPNKVNQYQTNLKELKYMQLNCSIKYNYCLYNKQKINLDFYLKMKTLQEFQEFSLNKTIGDFYAIDVFVSEDFFSIYNKQGVTSEKDNFNRSFIK